MVIACQGSHQIAEWQTMGLVVTPPVESALKKAIEQFSLAATSSAGFWLVVWLTIRLWVLPEHPGFLRFQGILGVVALAISIAVLALIEQQRRVFAAVVPDA